MPKSIKEMLKGAAPDACKLLVKYMNDDTIRPELRIKCCEIIFDRVYGKPIQGVDLDVNKLPQVVFVGDDKIYD